MHIPIYGENEPNSLFDVIPGRPDQKQCSGEYGWNRRGDEQCTRLLQKMGLSPRGLRNAPPRSKVGMHFARTFL